MKQTALILGLTLLVSLGLKSQDYVPFPTANVNWNVFYAGTCSDTPPDTTLIRYTIHGDTTIIEIQYAKLCVESGDLVHPTIQAIGGIREVDKKIYYIGQDVIGGAGDDEYLLYDFTKQIGDTIRHDSYGSFYSVVLDIDVVTIDGIYRKRYKVDNHGFHHNPDFIIEGIGSVKNGLLGHITNIPTCGSHYWEHICFSENGIVKYLNPSFNDCFPSNLLAGVERLGLDDSFEIYPNPFGNRIKIKNTSNRTDLIFKLIDINGKTLVEKGIKGEAVDLEINIRSGIYNAIITDKSGKVLISKRLVRN